MICVIRENIVYVVPVLMMLCILGLLVFMVMIQIRDKLLLELCSRSENSYWSSNVKYGIKVIYKMDSCFYLLFAIFGIVAAIIQLILRTLSLMITRICSKYHLEEETLHLIQLEWVNLFVFIYNTICLIIQ